MSAGSCLPHEVLSVLELIGEVAKSFIGVCVVRNSYSVLCSAQVIEILYIVVGETLKL